MNPSLTILLLDEEPTLRRATAMMLKSRGGQVSSAGTLDEAVALTEERIFDVAILDVAAGGPSAATMVAELRTHGLLPRRVVICSPETADGPEASGFPVLQKPYPFDHLISVVFGPSHKRRPTRSGVFSSVRPAGRQRARAVGAEVETTDVGLRDDAETTDVGLRDANVAETTGVGLTGRHFREGARGYRSLALSIRAARALRTLRRGVRARRDRG